jgi:hypothetical protein
MLSNHGEESEYFYYSYDRRPTIKEVEKLYSMKVVDGVNILSAAVEVYDKNKFIFDEIYRASLHITFKDNVQVEADVLKAYQLFDELLELIAIDYPSSTKRYYFSITPFECLREEFGK